MESTVAEKWSKLQSATGLCASVVGMQSLGHIHAGKIGSLQGFLRVQLLEILSG